MTNQTLTSGHDDRCSGEFRGQRSVDLLITSTLLIILSPLLALRASWALIRHGRCFETRKDESAPGQESLARFAGTAPGAGMAGLFSVFSGRATLVEPPGSRSRPGLVSTSRTRQNLGTQYLVKSDEQFCWGLKPYFSELAKFMLAATFSPARQVKKTTDFHLFGIKILNARMTEVLDKLQLAIENGRKTTVGFVNADCMNKSFVDERYHETLKGLDLVYPDGIGVRLAAQMFHEGVLDNVNGTDLFPLLCERLASSGHSLYLLGAREGIAAQVAKNMQDRFPGLIIAGSHHGYFQQVEEDSLVEKINQSGATVLLVALGAPAQEQWIERNRERLNTCVMMGVGGLFDFYSGRIERAPVWIREIGLEWSWRLLQEPGRMWRRYVVGNPLFLYRAWSEKRRHGSVGRPSQMTPCRENQVLEHFGNLDRGVRLRSFGMTVRGMLWKFPKLFTAFLKRLFDIIISALMLLLLAPLFAVVFLGIRIESPGNAFYSQMRVGYRGRMFKLWKFRSMYIDAEQRREQLAEQNEMEGGVIFKLKKDPRITRMGGIIRKTSIDELPQLWNVLKGEMSLVGPRPALASEVELYTIEDRVRLMAKPGLTCIWQVSGRSDIPFHQQVQLDEDYIYSQSVITDLRLLLQTIPAVIRGKGAY